MMTSIARTPDLPENASAESEELELMRLAEIETYEPVDEDAALVEGVLDRLDVLLVSMDATHDEVLQHIAERWNEREAADQAGTFQQNRGPAL